MLAPMNFPLDARFKLLAIAQQVSVRDAGGTLLYYARQKAFKLREAVTIFADEAQTRPLFRIGADRILDISARYKIEDSGGVEHGVVQRQGMKSFWRTHYTIEAGMHGSFTIREENPWTKVLDGLFGSLPIIGILSGYLFHPAYTVAGADGAPVLRITKQPALFEGKFEIAKVGAADDAAMETLVVGSLMMLLLERQRG